MKRILSISLLVFAGFLITVQGQDRRTLETKVADVLTQMPTYDLTHRDRLMQDMLNLGADGLAQFTSMLVPAGTGDDTRVRFALGNLAHFVGQAGKENDRLMVSAAFCKALEAAKDAGVKSFYLYHLNFVGKDEAVPFAVKYLNDPVLSEPAAAFLTACNSHAALHAMLEAIPTLSEPGLVTVVGAVSTYGAPCSLEVLTGLAEQSNPSLRKAVLSGLARIGDPASEKTLTNAAKAVGYAYEPTGATAALLKYAEVSGEKGHLEISSRVCKSMIKKCTGPEQLNFALAATGILVDQQGYGAMDYLLKGITHPEKHFRGGILRHAEKITDIAATRDWITVYASANPEIRSELMSFFGDRGALVVLPLVREALKSTDPGLKKEALIALGKLRGSAAVPEILATMATSDKAGVEAAHGVLTTLVGKNEISLVAESFDKQGKEGKIAVLDLLAARQAKAYFDLVRVNLGNSDVEVRDAAYAALQKVSSGGNLDVLLNLLYLAQDDHYLAEMQHAIINAARQAEGDQTSAVLKAYESATQNKHRFIGILPRLGGAKALETVSNAFANGDGSMKEVAFDALTNWSDHSASTALYDICKNASGNYHGKAFDGYVRQIKSAPVTPDQKLLLLKKIFGLAKSTDQQLSVIKALEGNKTFLTLIFMGELMENKALANAAGRAAATVALPPSGSKEGMYGEEVRRVLNKAIPAISGEEADYVKANIRTWLEEMPQDSGFVSMFNGENLEGWQGLVQNPIARAKMTPKQLAKEQALADARLPENWTVVNGEIRFTGTGYENLCSVKDYADFEMIVDWRITRNGDSGIYLRGTPQVQIWDTSRVDVGAQVGSGGLYNNQKNERIPLVVADNPIEDWNTFHIIMVGERVTVYLNGQLVCDNVTLENYWDRSIPIFPSGAIELQAHGTDLAFRNIYVREIKSGEFNLSVEEKAEGFVSLFNGKNLDGWIGNKTDYLVEESVIVIRPTQGGHGNLYTEKEYADFNFRFEFQLTPGANNGLGIRTPAEGDAAYVGMELQILDNTAAIYANLEPYQYHGSVYGVIPAKRGFLNPVGEWNSEEVIVQGTRIKIILNGEVIVDGDIADARDNGTMDHRDHPGLKNSQGHIGFLGHGSVVKFRNIRIKEL